MIFKMETFLSHYIFSLVFFVLSVKWLVASAAAS